VLIEDTESPSLSCKEGHVGWVTKFWETACFEQGVSGLGEVGCLRNEPIKLSKL